MPIDPSDMPEAPDLLDHNAPTVAQGTAIMPSTSMGPLMSEGAARLSGFGQPGPEHGDADFHERVPVINLPHRWDEYGAAVTSPEACSICGWDGQSTSVYGFNARGRTSQFIAAYGCGSCHVLQRIRKLASHREKTSPLDSVRMVMPKAKIYVDLFKTREKVILDIFRPSGRPRSEFDMNSQLPPTRKMTQGSAVETSSQWAHIRITECLRSHTGCRQDPEQQGPFMPTRLIDVTPNGLDPDVRLRHRTSIPTGSAYTALSYCWGRYAPECMTKSATIEQNMARIPWKKLPNTFRDAVKFTRSLGLKYLWIDSICIIQDDEKDWLHEAGKMFHVYRSSYVTLAALFGHDSTTGLRSMSMEQQSTLVAELRLGQTTSPLYMRPCHYLDSAFGPRLSEDPYFLSRHPLLYRAWTFQERVLSPRLLFFTEAEVVFECFENIDCECGSAKDRLDILAAYDNICNILLPIRAGQHFSNNGPDDWRNYIVPEYSSLNITKLDDRLPALAAFAEQFHRIRPAEQYLAGLWSGSLHEDLLWQRAAVAGTKPFSEAEMALQGSSSVPTWSWASVPGPVRFAWTSGTITNKYKATVIQAFCNYEETNSFTVLESSLLVFRSRRLFCTLEREGSDVHLGFSRGKHWNLSLSCRGHEWLSNEGSISMSLDHTLRRKQYTLQQQPEEVWLFEILGYDRSSSTKRERYFLVLEREGQNGNAYTRRGILKFETNLDNYRSCGDARQGDIPELLHANLFSTFLEEEGVEMTCELR